MTTADDTPDGDRDRRRTWVIRILVGVLAAVLVVAFYYVMAAFVPRWWAQLVGRQVDGRLGRGIVLGLLYGGVFTFLPLLVLAQIRRPGIDWPIKVGIAAGAIALATPNLLTLSISVGVSRAAQAADRVMDVQAPGFRYASLWGAVMGGLLAVVVVVISELFQRRGAELDELRERLARLEPETADKPADADGSVAGAD